MSLRDRQPGKSKRRQDLEQYRRKDAVPVPILCGATLVDLTDEGREGSHIKNDTTGNGIRPTLKDKSELETAKCRTKTSHPQVREAVSRQSETLHLHPLDLHPKRSRPEPQVEVVRSPAALSIDETTHPCFLRHPCWLESTSYQSHRLLNHTSQQTAVVVNRAAIPRDSNLSGDHASLDLKLGRELAGSESQSLEQAVRPGKGECEYNTEADRPQPEENKANSPSSEHHNLTNGNIVAAAQVPLQFDRTLPPIGAATIASASSRQDIAGVAAKNGSRLQAGMSNGSPTKADNGSLDPNMDPFTARQDGFPGQCGHLYTLPLLPPPLSHWEIHQELLPYNQERMYLPTSNSRQSQADPDHLEEPEEMMSMPILSHISNKDRPAMSENCPTGQQRIATSPVINEPPYRQDVWVREATRADIQLDEMPVGVESSAKAAESPVGCNGSELGSEGEEQEYETPLTSPGNSPLKSTKPNVSKRFALRQFDGEAETIDDEEDFGAVTARARAESAVREALESLKQSDDTQSDLVVAEAETDEQQTALRSQHDPIDLTMVSAEECHYPESARGEDIITPLVPASPAKHTAAFPFPSQPSMKPDLVNSPAKQTSSRHPRALLRHCERKATPRQCRLLMGGVQSPDRFITSRAATPTMEALVLTSKDASKKFARGLAGRSLQDGILGSGQEDPFGPSPRRSLRMAEQYATVRSSPPVFPPRAVGMIGSRVRDAQQSHRLPSAGTVWTVGGSIVTEGVASTSNGRGGRVTSGTSAPHYMAAFLRKDRPSEKEIVHGRRLAVAMDLELGNGMMQQGSPRSSVSPSGEVAGSSPGGTSGGNRVWKNGGWELEGVSTPTKEPRKKAKEVPIIPFRVLDAPALRDDYYCSLLAYCHTIECLAVGLGPHVYLWSENRGTTSIPDSLTAPLGTAHVTSLSFSSRDGGSSILAIGRADGRITLWSPLDRDPRFDSEQPAPVSSVCFRPSTVKGQSLRDSAATAFTEELLVGDEIGYVYYYSIEWPNQDQRDLFDWHGSMTLLARISCHSQQVCGIAWSLDCEFLATGGNDNQLFLFESKKILRRPAEAHRADSRNSSVHVRSGSSGSSNATLIGQGEIIPIIPGQEKHVFALNAAVKAIAFAPWQPTLLAAGGGSNDRCIHFFHTLSGASLATIDCHAQVTSLVWSEKRKEIAATFGFAQPEHPYRVAVFTWPSCRMVVGIPWLGEERALYSVAYPRGPSGGQLRDRDRGTGRVDAEGRPWYGRRTGEEGCLVVATSDASIKFHEIWAERQEDGGKRVASGVLGGSQILEGECSADVESRMAIR